MPLVTLDDCLGQPDNWINILQESGVLSAIDADLVFWQTKPSLTNPQLRATRFTSAASFLVAAAQQKQIPWRTFRKELSGNLMMLRELDFRLGITSAATSQSAMSAALTGSPSSEPEALAVGTLLWTNLDVLWRVVPDVRPAAWNEGKSAFLSWFHTNVAQGKLLDKIGRSLKYAANYQSDMEAKELCVALRYVYHLISSQSPFAAKFALSYNPMYEGLNSKWSSLSDERKDARIESILKSAEIAAKIREQAPYLLPGNATLADWRKNLSGAWVGLIKVLIEWAERKLARDFTTYPVSDVRIAMKKALEAVEQRASLKELVIFSPTMTAADREIAWPATASNFIKQKDMAIWLNEPEMVNEDLSQEEVNLMFKQLMEKEACGPDLRIPILKTAYDYITQLPVAERWPMLEPHEFMDSFFKPPAAGGPSRDLNFTVNTDWKAEKFLADIHVNNSAILVYLAEYEGENLPHLKLLSSDILIKELKEQDKSVSLLLASKVASGLLKLDMIKA